VPTIVIVLAGVLYAAGIVSAHRRGARWPVLSTLCFYLLGLGSYAWVSYGFFGTYSFELRYAFTTRIALLLFGVPWLVSLGKPVGLAEVALSEEALDRLHRFFGSRFMRLIGNAVFEPLFTLAVFMVFLTPVSAFLRLNPVSQDVVSVLIPIAGLLMVAPIMEDTRKHQAVFLAFEFMIAFAALIFDAVPAILLRLNTTVLDHLPSVVGALPTWFPSALRDQQLSGDYLWFLAEVADIPVIIILFLRWARIDKKESQAIDELSDEEMEALTRAHLQQHP
jgi:cytochrome c oxidase assembly factor CtaG